MGREDIAREEAGARDEFRERRERALKALREVADAEIDIDFLIGAKGQRQTPIDSDWPDFAGVPRDSEDAVTYGVTPSTVLTHNANEFITYDAELELLVPAVRSTLGSLLDRLTLRAAEPFRQTIDQMMEPVRTIAINCLLWNIEPEDAARVFGTSVETIDFLVELALHELAGVVEFRMPPPAPEAP